jgi:hypothetical protein
LFTFVIEESKVYPPTSGRFRGFVDTLVELATFQPFLEERLEITKLTVYRHQVHGVSGKMSRTLDTTDRRIQLGAPEA